MDSPTYGAVIGGDRDSLDRLLTALRSDGFACLHLDAPDLHAALETALGEAARLDGFRFPPIDATRPNYTKVQKQAFEALFTIATNLLDALVMSVKRDSALHQALAEMRHAPQPLFQRDDEPFVAGQPFSQSFFNLFNYDSGLLNPHADRSLLTVIKVRGGRFESGQQSALWVCDAEGQWRDADAAVGDDEVIVLVGEDFASLPIAAELGVYAAEHAVRVDPTGEYVSHSHFRPDPATPPEGNRVSAAFILRHEEETSL